MTSFDHSNILVLLKFALKTEKFGDLQASVSLQQSFFN